MHVMEPDPAPARDIGDAVVASKITALLEMSVHDAVQTCRFLGKALDRLSGGFRRRRAAKIMSLAGHGPQTASLPKQPLQRARRPHPRFCHQPSALLRSA